MNRIEPPTFLSTLTAGPSNRQVPVRGRVLILGTISGLTHRIAQQLMDEGLEPVVPGLSDDRLPRLDDPQAAGKMREILARFGEEARAQYPRGSHYVHPALSNWAERPELSTIGNQEGVSVIAPAPKVLALFGNKLNLFEKAEEIGIPNLIIDPEPMHSAREIQNFIRSRRQKFPFILKTAKGASRFGLTAIHEATELEAKLPLWLEQLRKSCGEVILVAERYLEGSRLITVPFARFLDGRSRTFPMVDASLQCRHRKVVELCPAQKLSEEMERMLEEWTLRLAEHSGYVGVGSLEFLIDSDRAYLIGGTPRLNAAFHLWEKVAGTQAISWQLAAMQGGSAVPPPPTQPEKRWRSALAIRLYAEDPMLQLPQPGIAREVNEQRHWEFPIGEAELDLMLNAGEEVSPGEEGWIGTLWVGSQERSQAMKLAQGVLDQIWIAGSLQTNERFLAELLAHPWVREGIFHTGFVDEEFLPSLRPPADLLRLFASVLEAMGEGRPGHRWAVGDQWVKPDPAEVRWVEPPQTWKVKAPSSRVASGLANGVANCVAGGVTSDAASSGEMTLLQELTGTSGWIQAEDGRRLRICAYPLFEGRWQVRLGPWVMIVRRVPGKSNVKPRPRISALIPGRIHSILYREGASVVAHEPVLIIESLGMLIPHALPVDVRINRWRVNPEQPVHAGQDLAEFEVLAKT